ncbi:MAG: UvrD-helicase domain-containing protein [Candidatus Cloacimonadota bacterium]
MIDYERELNPEQLRVVTTTEKPILVLAGAGSGKTKSIIYRCAYLMRERNVHPWNILVVTFTNKAAKELQTRLEKLLKFPVQSLWVGTFHSICNRILRIETAHLPFHSNFSIYDDDDQKSLLKKIYKEHGFDSTKVPIPRVLSGIGRNKNRLLLPEDLKEKQLELDDKSGFFPKFLAIYTLYQQQLLLNQALDFDDILLYTAKLLRDNQEVRAKYQKLFQYVMIDEYQDTNQAQFQIIYQIAREHHRVCVVGDDDQAIYSFRGASIRNILEFEKDYPGVESIRLEQNYRSTTAVLELANAIIKQNRLRHPKELWSELGAGEKPLLESYENENEEAAGIASKALMLHREGLPLREIAVLYRTNAQSRVLEHALLQAKIPYTIVGSLYFYQRKEIKDFLAYLASLANPADNEALLRIINEPPRGIGQTSQNHLLSFAGKTRITLYQAITNVEAVSALQKSALLRIRNFADLLERWRCMVPTTEVYELVKTIMDELGLIAHYQASKDSKEMARAENLVEFMTSVSEFSERFRSENDRDALLFDYLPFVALQTSMDLVSEQTDAMRLMTLHNCKGLEFDAIFIAGVEEELLPHRMSLNTLEDIEEERRLFYVGVTRARKKLRISYARLRRLYQNFYYPQPSQFLKDLDASLFANPGLDAGASLAPRYVPKLKIAKRESQKVWQVGQTVYHKEHGKGIVLGSSGEGDDASVTVSFTKGKLVKIVGRFLFTEPQ